MKCPKCRFENREGARFCLECGERLELKCPQCGSPVPAPAKFCDGCGSDLRAPEAKSLIDYSAPQSYTPKHLAEKILTHRRSIEGERKIVTVLFADVAGFASMSEQLDPEDVHRIMDGCCRILVDEIHWCEGTVGEFRGDGVMALFGAPIAHEDHAQRACHAALAIQQALVAYGEEVQRKYGLEFKMRIGLNSGMVVVGSIGDDLRMDYTAMGDTTNLAARMESSARPGSILVSKHIYRQTKEFFEFQPLGEIQVKGKEGPVEAYQLLRPSQVQTRIGASTAKGLTRFMGRNREMETLQEAFEKVRSGEGQVVGIVGEAGVGKSRLLLEFRHLLPQNEYNYFEGQCLHYGGAMPYLPLLDVLRSFLEVKEGEQEIVVRQKLKERILGLDENLQPIIPPIEELLSLQVDDEAYLRLEPKQKREKTFEALRDLLIRGSQDRPLILTFEDLHWIDQTTEEFLNYMIGWLPRTRILLLLLYRSEYTHQWGSKSYYRGIGVGHLSTGTSAELVGAILEGGEVVPELKELILTRAAGNPLFMEELTYSLLDNGSIQKKDDCFILTREASRLQVPDTIQGIIAARMDRLEESLKRIVQVAAVIGREFAFRILETILEMKEELKSGMVNLQGLEFIYEKSLFPELEYIFRHALVQEVAYNSLLTTRRKEIHEKIGRAIESLHPQRLEEFYGMLAYHYGRSDDAEKAVQYLDLANRKAEKVHAMQEAKAYFDEAMKLLDTMPENEANRRRRVSMIVNQIMVFELLLDFKGYYEHLTKHERDALSLGDQSLLGAYWARMGHCEWSFGQYDQASRTLSRAAEILEAGKNAGEAGYAYMLMVWNNLCLSNFDQVFFFKELALRMIEQQFHLRWYVWVFCPCSYAYTHKGQWDSALKEAHRALSVSEEYADDSMISFANWITSLVYTSKGDSKRAIEHGELAVQKAPTLADKAWSQIFLGWALCRGGELRRGLEILTMVTPLLRGSGFELGAIISEVPLCEAYWLAGEYEKSKVALEELDQRTQRSGMRFWRGSGQRLQGEVALKTDPSNAAVHFEKSIAILREIQAENELALAYAGYGRMHRQQGDITRAREYLTQALEIFERLGTLIEPEKVRRELTELPDMG